MIHVMESEVKEVKCPHFQSSHTSSKYQEDPRPHVLSSIHKKLTGKKRALQSTTCGPGWLYPDEGVAFSREEEVHQLTLSPCCSQSREERNQGPDF